MDHRSSLLCGVVVLIVCLQVFVAGVPSAYHQQLLSKETLNPSDASIEVDDDVEELHKLGWSQSGTRNVKTEPKSNNKDDEKRAHPEKNELINEITSNRDTPRDMAEYIFWTGDEHGVTSAIKDFVEQGLMSELEGMTFLEEVRYDLHQMKLRFGDEIDADEDKTHHPLKAQFTVQEDDKDVEKDDDEKDDDDDDKDNDDDKEETVVEIQPLESEPEPASNLPPAGDKVEQHGKSHGEIVVTSFEPKKAEAIKPVNTVPEAEKIPKAVDETKSKTAETKKDESEEEQQLAQLISNEYSLEEIIYQLARILFSQSLHQVGNPEAEDALKKFADFLEKESQDGKMSPQLQKKVLDVLLMSLFDAMGDHGNPSFSVSKLAADLERTSHFPEKH